MATFSKGIILRQYKEPAYSRPLAHFVHPRTESRRMDRDPVEDPARLTTDEIIEIAREAGIVDERDGKKLYRKLLRARGVAIAVIADAVDDEPYVSSQINPLLKLREEAAGGLRLCQRVAGTDNVFIMAYKNITDLRTRVPRSVEGFKVVRLRGGYPAESHSAKLNVGAGRKLVVGACALIHLHRAVAMNRPQATVFLTVAGNCVASPMNLEVSVGMTVMQVLERVGLNGEPTRVVCGGPMTGFSVMDTESTLITWNTRAILAFREDVRRAGYSCIGCGRCEQACPAGLNPMYLHRFVENHYYVRLKPFDAHLCIGCGTCSYLCPSKLNLAASAARARAYALEHYISTGEEGEDLEA